MKPRVLSGLISSFVLAACGGSSATSPASERPETRDQSNMAAQAEARTESTRESGSVPSTPGLQTMQSNTDFANTVGQAKTAIEGKGLEIMAEVDHSANAQGVGMELAPTTVLLFGNPKAGTQLMAVEQSTGIDLPMKLIVWQDDAGSVHVGYNDPAWIAQRHGVTGKDGLVEKMQGALSAIAEAASK